MKHAKKGFKGHKVNTPEIKPVYPASLSNHTRMLIKAEQRKKRKEMKNV